MTRIERIKVRYAACLLAHNLSPAERCKLTNELQDLADDATVRSAKQAAAYQRRKNRTQLVRPVAEYPAIRMDVYWKACNPSR